MGITAFAVTLAAYSAIELGAKQSFVPSVLHAINLWTDRKPNAFLARFRCNRFGTKQCSNSSIGARYSFILHDAMVT
jgi:hypothetical protein